MKQLREPKPDSKPVFRAVVQDTLSVEAEIRAVRRAPKPPGA